METAFEKILTNSHKPKMQRYLAEHPDCFEEAIQLAIADKQPYSWRAAWLLWSCMEVNDKRIKKHLNEIVHVLPVRPDNQKRELLKILQNTDVDQSLEGTLYNECVAIWEKINKQPSVRMNALKVLVQLAKQHPELETEVRALTQFQYTESLSSAVNRSIAKLLKGFQ